MSDTDIDIRRHLAFQKHERGECDSNCEYCCDEAEWSENFRTQFALYSEIARREGIPIEAIKLYQGTPLIKMSAVDEDGIAVEVLDSSLRFQFHASSLSCTGPVVGVLEFPRFILHKVDVDAETVTIELAEAVE